jgi:hypothetical protein
MTPVHTYANPPTRPGGTARVSASSRPIPRAPANDRKAAAWLDPVWATAVARAKLTAAVVALLAVIVFFVAAPPALTNPLAVISVIVLLVAGMFSWMEWLTRPDRRARGES